MPNPIDRLSEYIHLSDELLSLLHSVTIEKHFKRGDTIEVDPETLPQTYFVRKGSARAFYIRNGRERTYSFAFDDEIVATPITLLKIPDTIMCIEFLEPTDMIIIPRQDVRKIMEQHNKAHSIELAFYFLNLLFDNTLRLEERLLMFQLMNATERYHWFVTTYPTVTERATLTQIASYLGIAKETLYRIRSGKYINDND